MNFNYTCVADKKYMYATGQHIVRRIIPCRIMSTVRNFYNRSEDAICAVRN